MTFPEYGDGLKPFCSYGKNEAEFFTALIGNFIKDAAMDACALLKRKPDTRYRYFIGARPITPKDANYVYTHRDIEKFTNWIWDQMDESDSYDAVSAWLKENNVAGDDPAVACTTLLESIMLEISKQQETDAVEKKRDTAIDLKLIAEIQAKIDSLPKPKDVPVPPTEATDEQPFIEELLRAYGDAENKPALTRADLEIEMYADYADDLADRRVDYYAAETIRRGVLELGKGNLSGQFDVLKDETLSGVKDIARSNSHANGYERMLAVMQQAAITPVTNYLLGSSPYWISGRIKQGVCHHLVNAKKLRWVKRRNVT